MSVIVDSRLWDAFSRSNPYYHTISWESFRDPDAIDRREYWESGERVVNDSLALADVHLRPDDHAVEIGSGLGRLALPLARRCGHVFGVDPSQEMVAAARREAAETSVHNVTYILGDGRSLRSIRSAGMDLAISFTVFQHLSKRSFIRTYIHEMARVLRPGGTAILQCPTWRVGTMFRQGARNAGRFAGYLARPSRIVWRIQKRIREHAKLRRITADLAAGAPRSWSEDDLRTMLLHPARRMKSIYQSRLLHWLRQADFTDIRIIWPDDTYTTIAARRDAV